MTGTRTVLVAHPGSELFGSDRMALESVRAFRDAGDRVVVALPEQGPLVAELLASGAEVVILPQLVLRKSLMKPSGWLRLFRDTFRGLGSGWRLISRVRPDAVYVSTITIPEWPALARMRGIPVVTHVHEAEASGSRLVSMALYLPHLASTRIIANSEFTLRTMCRYFPKFGPRSVVIQNGIAGPADVTAPRDVISGALRVLYVGRLSERKGPDLLLSAATALRQEGFAVEVSFVGASFRGNESYDAQLRAQALDSGMGTDIKFLGFDANVWPHLACADVVVVPSRDDESFGNTVVESIMAQRPVVVSAMSGLQEAATDYATTWLIEPDDPRAIAAALRTIADEWPNIVAHVAASAHEAHARHAPLAYRAKVRDALIIR